MQKFKRTTVKRILNKTIMSLVVLGSFFLGNYTVYAQPINQIDTYKVKYILRDTNEDLLGYESFKMGIRGEKVVEKAIYFGGYKALETEKVVEISEDTKDVVFEYEKEDKRIGTYQVKYIDSYSKKSLYDYEIKKMGIIGDVLEEKALDFKGYILESEPIQNLKLTEEDEQIIVFRYKKTRDTMELEEYLKEPIDFENKVSNKGIDEDFSNDFDGAVEYVTKAIYEHQNFAKFYGAKGQCQKVVDRLTDLTIQGVNVKFVTNFTAREKPTSQEGVYECVIGFMYGEDLETTKLVEERISEIVNELNKKITEYTTDVEKVKLIYEYVIDNVSFYTGHVPGQLHRNKNRRDVHFSPAAVFDGESVCLGYAMLFGRISERMGIDSRLVVGISKPMLTQKVDSYLDNMKNREDEMGIKAFKGRVNHAWNQVKINGKWYHVDPSHDDYQAQISHKPYSYFYFLRSDEFLNRIDFKNGWTYLKLWNKECAMPSYSDYPGSKLFSREV